MTDTPEPLTPPECDLRDFPFMPLEVARLRRSKAWLAAKREPALAFYLINLWTAAWHDLPAASLEDDDEVLADLAMCDTRRWQSVKAAALRGWIKCSDGRLYHPVVAEKARTAWESKLAQRDRTKAAREAREAKRIARLSNGGQPPDGSATDTVTGYVTDNVTSIATRIVTSPVTISVTDIATIPVTASKREGEGEGEGYKERKKGSELRSDAEPASISARDEVWSDGLAMLRHLTGQTDQKARGVLGRLCREAKDNCANVMSALRAAVDARPGDPIAWLMAAVQARRTPSNPFMAVIAEEGIGGIPLEFPMLEAPDRVH